MSQTSQPTQDPLIQAWDRMNAAMSAEFAARRTYPGTSRAAYWAGRKIAKAQEASRLAILDFGAEFDAAFGESK